MYNSLSISVEVAISFVITSAIIKYLCASEKARFDVIINPVRGFMVPELRVLLEKPLKNARARSSSTVFSSGAQ